jgi:hypothetical protein
VFQSSLETADLAGQLRSDLQLHLQHRKPQFKKKSQRRIQYTGSLTVHDANRHIKFRNEEERYKELRRIKKARTLGYNQPTLQADTAQIGGSGEEKD